MHTSKLFPDSTTLELFDPLAQLLGAGDGVFTYTFDDAIKLAGHACPTVAGAFVMAQQAMARLYPQERPLRGGIRIRFAAPPDQGANGPFTQVLTLLTGAAAENGFAGLGGQHVRKGLLSFEADAERGPVTATFERNDTGEQVTLQYDASPIPADPHMMRDLQQVLSGNADDETIQRFRKAWADRVSRILQDGGQSTISES
ncbi:hypothetical protein [Thiohalomonas denitrificans]|uniref:Formylmethanofuran dehydrogenase subunit E domain-containing protein n=1 Tax=Thiohalomonas denitrificans TaxID=415747 RepID=A0A1G5R313_9GAMM|nr:hypothetical protein [Thiohalomonas denitrificans]SCZ67709.1 hypothetical protein SAMN03097708_03184 [Thiohalomonas denitrificans]